MAYNTKKANKAGIYDKYDDFDLFIKNVKIPEKYWKFFKCFTDEKSDTFGNATKSYIKAGYKENSTTSYRAKALYDSKLIQRLIALYHQKTAEKRINRDLSVFDRTDNDLMWCIERAKLSGDYQAVRQASMDRAKLHGQLVDKHQVIDPITEQSINRTKQIEAAQLAEQRLLGEPTASVIDTVFEEQKQEACKTELYNEELETAILNA